MSDAAELLNALRVVERHGYHWMREKDYQEKVVDASARLREWRHWHAELLRLTHNAVNNPGDSVSRQALVNCILQESPDAR